jgi:HD superfamily phosphohydrolase/NAD-dependent SIR2 family protein deacetylase
MNENEYKVDMKDLAERICKARLKRKKVMVLVGSGISLSAKPEGVPSLTQIFDHFYEETERTEEENPQWERLRSNQLNERTIRDLYPEITRTTAWRNTHRWLWEVVKKAEPTEAHKVIAQLCKKGYIDYVFSLNYDDLFEKAEKEVSGDKIFNPIKVPENLTRSMKEPKRRGTPLIKAHGDLFMLICPHDGTIIPITRTTSPDDEIFEGHQECPKCGTRIAPHTMLPDGTKLGSEKFISSVSAKRREFDLLICVGFSGRFDFHIVDMVRIFKKFGTLIYNIDPEPREMLSILGHKGFIKTTADETFKALETELQRIKGNMGDNIDLNLDFVDIFFDPVYKNIKLTNIEKKTCYTELFRRLQGIHQLGLKYCKFIGANHTRFEHSIGVMQVSDDMYMSLKYITDSDSEKFKFKPDVRRNKIERQFLRLAALLHDVGHVSFGHMGEEILKEEFGKEFSHETFSTYILSQLMEAVKPDSRTNPYEWHDLLPIEGNLCYTWRDLSDLMVGGSGIKVLDKIIKSTFDADKIEYLLRDSKMTGKDYGTELDKSSLFDNLIVNDDNDLVIGEGAVSALERIAEARYHMYKEVYFDTDVRGYETLLKKVLKAWVAGKRDNEGKRIISFDRMEKIAEYLFRNDLWLINQILEDIRADFKTAKRNREEGVDRGYEIFRDNEQREFARRALMIIKGEEPLPKRLLIEVTHKHKDKMKKIMENLPYEIETKRYFLDKVVIDTYTFAPYKKEEEPRILTHEYDINQENSSLKEKDLRECSQFIDTLSRSYEYKIRVYLMDKSLENSVLDKISTFLKGEGIGKDEWEVKEYE